MEIIKEKFRKPNHNFLIKDMEELEIGGMSIAGTDWLDKLDELLRKYESTTPSQFLSIIHLMNLKHSNHALYEHLVTRDIDKLNFRELAKIVAGHPEEKVLGNHREGKEMAFMVTPGKQGGSKEGFGSG